MKPVSFFKKFFAPVSAVATGILVTFASIAYSTNYYVDNLIGSDSNTGKGTTAELAWKTLTNPSNNTFAPGDSILFKAGGVWVGYLYIYNKANGTAAKPIVIDMYGTGAKPKIQGDQTGAEAAAVYLRNNTYLEFNNFEVTGAGGLGLKIATGAPSTSCFMKIKNLIVHDITRARTATWQAHQGGIIIKDGGGIRATVSIVNCKVYDCKYNGIEFGSYDRGIMLESTRSVNNKIENCEIYNCGVNGLRLQDITSSTISNCKIYNCDLDNTQSDYPPSAILFRRASKITIEKCEIYNNKRAVFGFDLDTMSSKENIIQYNYIHDNVGGLLKMLSQPGFSGSSDNILRYNVCLNNGGTLFSFSNASGNKVYNNTVYSTSTTSISKVLSNVSGSTNNQFNNNIMFLNSNASYDAGAIWDYNCFFGSNTNQPTDAHKITTDPQFKSAGSGSTGMSSADGYILKTTSPCLNTGLLMTNAGTKDFWGNPVPHSGKTNIGAYDGTDGNSSIVPAIHKSASSPYVFSRYQDGRIAAAIANSGKYTISLLSLNGKILMKKTGIAPAQVTLPANIISSGAHLVRLDMDGQSFTRALMTVQ